jgi:hypothetical protein
VIRRAQRAEHRTIASLDDGPPPRCGYLDARAITDWSQELSEIDSSFFWSLRTFAHAFAWSSRGMCATSANDPFFAITPFPPAFARLIFFPLRVVVATSFPDAFAFAAGFFAAERFDAAAERFDGFTFAGLRFVIGALS